LGKKKGNEILRGVYPESNVRAQDDNPEKDMDVVSCNYLCAIII
jgi:hypothetical protein